VEQHAERLAFTIVQRETARPEGLIAGSHGRRIVRNIKVSATATDHRRHTTLGRTSAGGPSFGSRSRQTAFLVEVMLHSDVILGGHSR
jgi:hypothetical protein